MDRVWKSGAAGVAPADTEATSAGFPTAGNPAGGVLATKPGPYWYHMITEELAQVILSAGIPFNKSVLTQLSAAIDAKAGALSSTLVTGMSTARNAVDPAHDIDIFPGERRDDTDVTNIEIAATLTKRFDASFVAGNNQGALDGTENVAGTPNANSWLYLWAIKRSDTGAVDVIGSTSAIAPTMPANYDRKRRIWVVRIDGANSIVPYEQDGDLCIWRPQVIVLNGGTATVTTAVTISSAVPPEATLFKATGQCSVQVSTSNVLATNACIIRVAAGVDFTNLHYIEIGQGNFNNTGRLRTKGGQVTLPNTGTFEYRNSGSNQAASDSHIWIDAFKFPR